MEALLLLAAMALISAARAEAAQVSWTFSGQVSVAESALAGVIDAGDLLGGVVILDSATPDALPLDPKRGVYSDSVLDLAFTVGSYVGSGSGGGFAVSNDQTNAGVPILDALLLCTNPACGGALVGADIGAFTLEGFFINIYDRSGTALNSEALPTFPPDLSLFDEATFTIVFRGSPDVFGPGCCFTAIATGPLTAPQRVPAPSIYWLLVLGLAGTGAMKAWAGVRRR